MGPLAVIVAAVLWSIDGFLRQSLYAAPSLTVVALEHALGAILFLPALLWKRDALRRFTGAEWASVLWVGVFGGILGTFFYTKALGHVGYIELSVVVLLQKLQPFFAILLARAYLREPLSRRFLLLALVAFAGGYCVSFPTLMPSVDLSSPHVAAAALSVAAAFAWASSTVFSKHALHRHPFVVVTALRLGVTALIASAAALALGQHLSPASLDPAQWTSLLLIVCSTGAIALGVYYYGLKRVPASHATLYEMAWPLSALAIDWFLHGNVLTATQWLGAALLVGAIAMLPRERWF